MDQNFLYNCFLDATKFNAYLIRLLKIKLNFTNYANFGTFYKINWTVLFFQNTFIDFKIVQKKI